MSLKRVITDTDCRRKQGQIVRKTTTERDKPTKRPSFIQSHRDTDIKTKEETEKQRARKKAMDLGHVWGKKIGGQQYSGK